jgi:hypothetical protein
MEGTAGEVLLSEQQGTENLDHEMRNKQPLVLSILQELFLLSQIEPLGFCN